MNSVSEKIKSCVQEIQIGNAQLGVFSLSDTPPEYAPIFTLSYLGDAWYELWCRQLVLQRTDQSRSVNRRVVGLVRCEMQAQLAESLHPFLNVTEQQVFQRGKNSKVVSRPKNSSVKDYRAATGFECLVGYWYLSHQLDRFLHMMQTDPAQHLIQPLLQ